VINCTTAVVGMMLMPGRPASIGEVSDATTGGVCHWNRTQDEALCGDILEYLADSWQAQVVEEGWPEPFPDNGRGGSSGIDIYLHTSAEFGAYTQSPYVDSDGSDGRMGGEAYIVIDPRINDEMNLYVAHEFNHALQFAVDFTEPTLPPWEAAATVAEEVTYPGEGSWKVMAEEFNNTPWQSLLGDGYHLWDEYEIWSYYEYGSALWLEHLHVVYGVSAVDLWWAMTNNDWDNEPDVWDAYDELTGSAEDALVELAIARGRMGTSARADWAEGVPAPVAVQGALNSLDELVVPEYHPHDLGVVYFDVAMEGRLGFEIEGASATRWRIFSVDSGDSWNGDETGVVVGPGLVGAVNLGPEGFDPDDSCDWNLGCIYPTREVSMRLVEAPLDDSGDVDDSGFVDADTGGCGCSSSPRGFGMFMSLPFVLAAVLRRR
jgi:hypothetical protein